MNELIVELLNKYSNKGIINLNPLEFADIIQTACKAQAKACVRDFNNYAKRHEYSNNCARVILKAKIERQDYE